MSQTERHIAQMSVRNRKHTSVDIDCLLFEVGLKVSVDEGGQLSWFEGSCTEKKPYLNETQLKKGLEWAG